MSEKTGTGPKVRRAFGPGLGLADQVDLALGKQGVTPVMLNYIAGNPLVAKRVAAAIKGESPRAVSFDDLLPREVELTGRLIGTAPPENQIKQALETARGKWGGLTEDDRFIPPNLSLEKLFEAIYRFNEQLQEAGVPLLKLCHEQGKEWWRGHRDVQQLPTQSGVIRCNFSKLMRADLDGRPFSLNAQKQNEWAMENGGDGLTSAEETVFLWLRCLIEEGRPLWSVGSVRCRSGYGSESSLSVRFHADGGFEVDFWHLRATHWSLGAVPRKFAALEL